MTVGAFTLAAGIVAVLVPFSPLRPGEEEQVREQPITPQAVEKREVERTELVTPPPVLIHQPVPKYYHDYTRDGYVVQFNPRLGVGGRFTVVSGHLLGRRLNSVDVGEIRIQPDNAVIVHFLELQLEYNVALNDPGLEYIRRALEDPPRFVLTLLSCPSYSAPTECYIVAVVATRFTANP